MVSSLLVGLIGPDEVQIWDRVIELKVDLVADMAFGLKLDLIEDVA